MNHDKTMQTTPLESFPPIDQWDDWTELDPKAWPRKVENHYSLVPTTCFNCEAACGLVAYVDRDTHEVKRLEGNPHHPGSRGKNCAKGPATLNQIEDPERILYPMKRVGPRGAGKFERTTWDEVLDVFATKIRTALQEGRKKEVMYHVGRPGADGYMDRVLQSWGVDGHNSHTNVCSGAARLGYATWTGADRPSPDHEHAKFMLLISSHLETGHYFNPHAQRITAARMAGTKMAVCDVRLSNTASMADYWLAPFPGTEASMLLAMAHVLLEEELFNAEFVRTWVNWEDTLAVLDPETRGGPEGSRSFETFIARLKQHYAAHTPAAAEEESGVPAATIVAVAREIGKAGTAFATHVWRSAASGNLGGWQVARCLEFLCVLVGSVGAKGGTNLNSSDKFVAAPFIKPPPQEVWNELLYPLEWPLSHHELSFILPHLMEDQGAKLSAYFTRVYNPVWTNPDGMVWEQLLRDEAKIELHAALTPTWNETAQYADYVLPMGLGAERHDLMSQETHSAKWISFRQPVARVARERRGESIEWTYEANPGEVWEEDEFWIALSWRIDPDGSLGIRKFYESPYRPGERVTIHEYYQWIFENSVPGLPEAAAEQDLTPLKYMRRHGAFLVQDKTYSMHNQALAASAANADGETAEPDSSGTVRRDGVPVGVMADGQARTGFHTPSRKLELYSQTIADWGWPEYALPCYIESHVHRKHMDRSKGEFALVPTFRLPTLIHTRSGNAKWLLELSNTNPVWVHPEDAERLGLETCGLVRVSTRIGHFVNKVWVTEAMRPGVIACSHHLGRWRLSNQDGRQDGSYSEATVEREEVSEGVFRFRRTQGLKPFESADPDTSRIWWTDGGVHQNLTFPVQPDPVSGMHCWHQRVTLEVARPGDEYADVVVDTTRSREVYREWKAETRPAPGPDGLRRPLHFARAVKPAPGAYRV